MGLVLRTGRSGGVGVELIAGIAEIKSCGGPGRMAAARRSLILLMTYLAQTEKKCC